MNLPFIHLRTLSSYSLSESALKISDIIKILNYSNITFNEIKTFDEDLESIFLKITNDSI